ncbi:cysteinyl leukotriene receptor 2 isoform X2 [Pithys albifrons albifrons]|uniref:cysteinyl leukotriene receptor 2 isoform X2 n=1 Tax=Pithys albifrons albifrons TaxID=3385563 RepID=UPI003A5D1ABE
MESLAQTVNISKMALDDNFTNSSFNSSIDGFKQLGGTQERWLPRREPALLALLGLLAETLFLSSLRLFLLVPASGIPASVPVSPPPAPSRPARPSWDSDPGERSLQLLLQDTGWFPTFSFLFPSSGTRDTEFIWELTTRLSRWRGTGNYWELTPQPAGL